MRRLRRWANYEVDREFNILRNEELVGRNVSRARLRIGAFLIIVALLIPLYTVSVPLVLVGNFIVQMGVALLISASRERYKGEVTSMELTQDPASRSTTKYEERGSFGCGVYFYSIVPVAVIYTGYSLLLLLF